MSIDEKAFSAAWNETVNTPTAPEDTYSWALWGYRTALEAIATEQPVERTALAHDVEEYLHWRKVNPQIKGGENYLKRFRQSLAAPERKEQQPVELTQPDELEMTMGEDIIWKGGYQAGYEAATRERESRYREALMKIAGIPVNGITYRSSLHDVGKIAEFAEEVLQCNNSEEQGRRGRDD